MKKNLYYRDMYKRTNLIKEFFIRLFIGISSWPRLLLEVFVRSNFGERYFSFSIAVVIAVILITIPSVMSFSRGLLFRSSFGPNGGWSYFFLHWTSFYLFAVAFLFLSWRHRQSIKHGPSVFDFKKFSLYQGDVHPSLLQFRPLGKTLDLRQIETLVEPGLFFVSAIVLIMLGQNLGWLILICSVVWSLSMQGQYYLGDEFVMDKIDEMIHNEDLTETFVGDKTLDIDRGVRFFGRRPTNEEMREKLADSFYEDVTVEAVDMA